jgi:hypothetical protein
MFNVHCGGDMDFQVGVDSDVDLPEGAELRETHMKVVALALHFRVMLRWVKHHVYIVCLIDRNILSDEPVFDCRLTLVFLTECHQAAWYVLWKLEFKANRFMLRSDVIGPKGS